MKAPRDASGTLLADDGRFIINFGGVLNQLNRKEIAFSSIRKFDVCSKEWSLIGDLGIKLFALESCSSKELNIAITCGGHHYKFKDYNFPFCIVNKFTDINFDDK